MMAQFILRKDLTVVERIAGGVQLPAGSWERQAARHVEAFTAVYDPPAGKPQPVQ
jgi:hypothetical protein